MRYTTYTYFLVCTGTYDDDGDAGDCVALFLTFFVRPRLHYPFTSPSRAVIRYFVWIHSKRDTYQPNSYIMYDTRYCITDEFIVCEQIRRTLLRDTIVAVVGGVLRTVPTYKVYNTFPSSHLATHTRAYITPHVQRTRYAYIHTYYWVVDNVKYVRKGTRIIVNYEE